MYTIFSYHRIKQISLNQEKNIITKFKRERKYNKIY